jgi:hypothetical protein
MRSLAHYIGIVKNGVDSTVHHLQLLRGYFLK